MAHLISKTLLPKGIKSEHILKEIHSFEGKVAGIIADYSGSMAFVYIHILWFGLWVLINTGIVKNIIPAFDPFPFGLLTMMVSLEAIFLSTFILINQNRQALIDTYRELEDVKEQREEDKEQEELEEEVEDIQKDLDDIKSAIAFIQQKVTTMEKSGPKSGNDSTPPKAPPAAE